MKSTNLPATPRSRLGRLTALSSSCALFFAGPGLAQSTETSLPAAPSDARSPILELNLDLTAGYTDNVFATRNYEVDDLLIITRPSARLTLVDGQNRMVIRGEGEIGRYDDVQSENYDDWAVGASRPAASSETAVALLSSVTTSGWSTAAARVRLNSLQMHRCCCIASVASNKGVRD